MRRLLLQFQYDEEKKKKNYGRNDDNAGNAAADHKQPVDCDTLHTLHMHAQTSCVGGFVCGEMRVNARVCTLRARASRTLRNVINKYVSDI